MNLTPEQCITRVIENALDVCKDEDFVAWASAWLDGSDRSIQALEVPIDQISEWASSWSKKPEEETKIWAIVQWAASWYAEDPNSRITKATSLWALERVLDARGEK